MEQKEIIIFIIVVSIAIAIFIVAIVLFIVFYRKKVMLQKNEYQKMKSIHQKELLSTQIEMQQQTMQHIGREIHDNIGQKLTLASLYTQQLAFENKAPQITETIENISAILNTSLSELRQLSKTLTDNAVAKEPLVTLIQAECHKIHAFVKCSFSFNKAANQLGYSYELKSVLVRIVQEFLQNSIKHSQCKNIVATLNKKGDWLELHLEDDGKGFDPTASNKGIGLSNIKKRAAIINGVLDVESSAKGTQLTLKIPL